MSATERSLIVADFAVGARDPGDQPSGRALVRAAHESGADRVAVDVRATSDGWALVSPSPRVRLSSARDEAIADLTLEEARSGRTSDGRVATLEETLLAAHRVGLGLVIRLHDTFAIQSLGAALGVMADDGPAALRARYVVVVPDSRIGKRLRMEAPSLPSARHVGAALRGLRGHMRRRFPNLARASADADDLMIDAALAPPQRVRERLVPLLRRRGAYVWVAAIPEDRRAEYEGLGAGGLLIDTPWRG